MPAKKNAPGTAPAPTPRPKLTVAAIVTVFLDDDGEAQVAVSLDLGGTDGLLVKRMRPATSKLTIAAAALRRVVVNTLDVKPLAPPAELKRMARGLATA